MLEDNVPRQHINIQMQILMESYVVVLPFAVGTNAPNHLLLLIAFKVLQIVDGFIQKSLVISKLIIALR